MSPDQPFHSLVLDFADSVAQKSATDIGQPESQLRTPFENLLAAAGHLWTFNVVCVDETPLQSHIGRPDFGIQSKGLTIGHAELKSPGRGTPERGFKGHDLEQFRRFSALPNLLYIDGNEWALYRNGELEDQVVKFKGDVVTEGSNAVSRKNARFLELLLRKFLDWQPVLPRTAEGQIDLAAFALMLAPLCRLLREEVEDNLQDHNSGLRALKRDWQELLFPDASDVQFADAYAQTVTFALLLGRTLGAHPLTFDTARHALRKHHGLLSQALRVLADDDRVRQALKTPFDVLISLIAALPPRTPSSDSDPWLYFYEAFLAVYDPKLREKAGVYYTPIQVVRAQVRLVDELLVSRLGRGLGLADPGVATLDPAAGTGSYLLAVIEHALARMKSRYGPASAAETANTLADNLHAFELLVGAYSVADLRVTNALHSAGGRLPPRGARVYLADTLESPNAKPRQMPTIVRAISEHRERALEIKKSQPILVCLGNPPYDRHDAPNSGNLSATGGWVRYGDDGSETLPLLEDFLAPARGEQGGQLNNIYNLYVYFWRWALWKVFEHDLNRYEAGVVSFITASSYLDGGAFRGMREHMRRECDEIWILDLGGDSHGARKDENIFAIQTPVAIAIALRSGAPDRDTPAAVRFARIEGSRPEKLNALSAIQDLGSVSWLDCPTNWQDFFRPRTDSAYFSWPSIRDLMPWQHSGAQLKRTWPIAHDKQILQRRWRTLLRTTERADNFRETRDRTVQSMPRKLGRVDKHERSISSLNISHPMPKPVRYGYRSFDRQWLIRDSRLGDFLRPALWICNGPKQLYLTSLLTKVLGTGPALTATTCVPDMDHFSGRGGKDVIPLYRDQSCSEPNLLAGLSELLQSVYSRPVTPEHFVSYLYGLLAQPSFTRLFGEELRNRDLRVPITRDGDLFEQIRVTGAHLLSLHTWGEWQTPEGEAWAGTPKGTAEYKVSIVGGTSDYPESFSYDRESGVLRVGRGEFHGVAPEVYDFEVSGLRVVSSWLAYRMRSGAGKKTSPLDCIGPLQWTGETTHELLTLLWALEATLAAYPEQERLLGLVTDNECFSASEFPAVPSKARKPPRTEAYQSSQIHFAD